MVPNHVPLVLAIYHSKGTTYKREHKLYGCQNCWQAEVSCSSPKPISVATIETSHITLYANSDGHFNVTSIINDKGSIRFYTISSGYRGNHGHHKQWWSKTTWYNPPPPRRGEPITIVTANGTSAAYKVKLDMFEGPLDLLLYLIKKEEVDIINIPVAKITKQYLEYVQLTSYLKIYLKQLSNFLIKYYLLLLKLIYLLHLSTL